MAFFSREMQFDMEGTIHIRMRHISSCVIKIYEAGGRSSHTNTKAADLCFLASGHHYEEKLMTDPIKKQRLENDLAHLKSCIAQPQDLSLLMPLGSPRDVGLFLESMRTANKR